MCDTQVLRFQGMTFFAKNSDREPSEPQVIVSQPAVEADSQETLQTTYLRIPQLAKRHAVILSKPAWMWGAEMGVNDQGVVIGNEAVFTRLVDRKNSALLGMDLLRLGLERGSTACEAMDTICTLLEEFGQGGPAGFRDKSFRYDNSYLIADADEAWVLETAGRHWAAKRVAEYTAISNALTIETQFDMHSNGLVDFARQNGYFRGSGEFSFAEAFDTKFMKMAGCAIQRRQLSLDFLQWQSTSPAVSLASMAAGLRQHHKTDHSSNRDVCMHASGLTRPSQTCGSMIVQLQPGQLPKIMVTGTSAPCISLFQPIEFSDDPTSAQQLKFQEGDDIRDSLWFRFEHIHRLAMLDADFRRDLRVNRDTLEPTLMGSVVGHPTVPEAQLLASDWHRKWADAAANTPANFRPWAAHHWFWKRLNRLDGIPRTM